MIKEAIYSLTDSKNLSFGAARQVFEEIFDHKVTPAQIAAFLTALKMKGESEDEISAAASVVRERAVKLQIKGGFMGIEDKDELTLDTCGTGGSGINKFNISTAVAFVASAAGIKVAKHGNRAMSSTSGSADVLEAMGVAVDVPPPVMEEAIKKVGIGFLYAPLYHPALKEVAQIRREMGTRTIFNILGPLCNPALVNCQLLGVYRQELVPVISRVLRKLGSRRAFVVYGKDLKDEVTLTGPTYVSFLNNKKIKDFTLKPSDFGLRKISPAGLLAKDITTSAAKVWDVFSGGRGPARDIVLANSSCCFYILGKAKTLKAGVAQAARLIDDKKVSAKFLEFKQFIDARRK